MERDLYKGIIEGAKQEGILLCRIVDSAYSGKKPFDMFGINEHGKSIAIEVKECKYTPELDKIPLRSHQKAWLEAWAKRDGISIVLCHDKTAKQIFCYCILGKDQFFIPGVLTLQKGKWIGLRAIIESICGY